MTLSKPAKKLVVFQAVNLLVSIVIVAGLHQVFTLYALFSVKIVLLIYFNDVPSKTDPFSLAFFVLAIIDVLAMLWLGSFSFYTVLFRL